MTIAYSTTSTPYFWEAAIIFSKSGWSVAGGNLRSSLNPPKFIPPKPSDRQPSSEKCFKTKTFLAIDQQAAALVAGFMQFYNCPSLCFDIEMGKDPSSLCTYSFFTLNYTPSQRNCLNI